MHINNIICKTCEYWKPLRSKHCKYCKGCQLEFDHHCPWITNCVGYKNHRSFYLFLAYMSVKFSFFVCFLLIKTNNFYIYIYIKIRQEDVIFFIKAIYIIYIQKVNKIIGKTVFFFTFIGIKLFFSYSLLQFYLCVFFFFIRL